MINYKLLLNEEIELKYSFASWHKTDEEKKQFLNDIIEDNKKENINTIKSYYDDNIL